MYLLFAVCQTINTATATAIEESVKELDLFSGMQWTIVCRFKGAVSYCL